MTIELCEDELKQAILQYLKNNINLKDSLHIDIITYIDIMSEKAVTKIYVEMQDAQKTT
jgi:hypothetical protein